MEQTEGMAATHTGYLPINGMQMYYEEYGTGTPLLLLHGGTSTSETWQPFLHVFTPHFRVFTPDSRAHGRSNNPSGVLSYRQMADDVAALIRALALEKPMLFGYSDGGQIALELGMHYPGLCRALVVGAAWYKLTPHYAEAMKAAGMPAPGIIDTDAILADSPDWVEDMKHLHISAPDSEYWKELLREISILWWEPLDYSDEDFRRISDPTMVLVGDRDEMIELQQAVDEYRKIPNAELYVIPNAFHSTAKSELSMQVVLDFLLHHTE